MDVSAYKFIHLIGILLVFQGIGTTVALAGKPAGTPWKKAALIGHGLGLVLILIAGFGMLAKLGYMRAIPGWAIGKLTIWLVLALLPSLLRRVPAAGRWVWGGAIGLGAIAVALALFHGG